MTEQSHPLRCRFDYFNDGSKPMCENWDAFYQSCKLLAYETRLDGKKETIYPKLNSQMLWIVEQVGCASHSSTTSAELVLEQIEKIISDRIQKLRYPKSHNCVREALLGENQALWAQIAELRAQRGREPCHQD